MLRTDVPSTGALSCLRSMPGFGDSDMPPEPHTADMLAGVVSSGLDVLIPSPVEVQMAGFSFGGIIAGLVAPRPGHRVGTLVLLEAGGSGLSPVATPPLLQIKPDINFVKFCPKSPEHHPLISVCLRIGSRSTGGRSVGGASGEKPILTHLLNDWGPFSNVTGLGSK